MTSLIAFANDLAKYFESSRNKKKAAAHIVYEINSYKDEHFKSISAEEKKIVVDLIEKFIRGDLPFKLKPREMIVRKHSAYDEFLEIKKYIFKHIFSK